MVASSVFAPVDITNASQVNMNINTTGYYVNVTSSGSVDLTINATPSGAVAIAKDPVVVKTNSKTGYKLYLSVDNDNAGGNRLYKDADSTSSSFLSPATGTVSTPAALDTNSWGFAVPGLTNFDPVYVDSNGNSSDGSTGQTLNASNRFAAVPLRSQEALISQTDSPNEVGVETDVYYGANATTSLLAGMYQGSVIYSIVAEGSNNIYGDASISPNATTTLTGGETVTIGTSLFASNVSASDVTVTIGGQACVVTGASNPDGAGLTITCTTPNLGALGDYDVIIQIPKYDKTYILTGGYHIYKPINQVTTMQEFTQYNCSQLTKPAALDASGNVVKTTAASEKTLQDIRDGYSYRIRRLADGNCWMTGNLRLSFADVNGDGVVGVKHSDGTTETQMTKSNTDLNSKDTYVPIRASQTSGGTSWTAGTDPTAAEANTDRSLTTGNQTIAVKLADGTNLNDDQYIGTYYGWYTATAGSGTYSLNTDNTLATDSICPKGWELPRNTGDKSWNNLIITTYKLITTQGDQGNVTANDKLHQNPFSLPYSGDVSYQSGAVVHQGSLGSFWSAAAVSAVRAHHLSFNGTYTWPQGAPYKTFGYSVRCVLR